MITRALLIVVAAAGLALAATAPAFAAQPYPINFQNFPLGSYASLSGTTVSDGWQERFYVGDAMAQMFELRPLEPSNAVATNNGDGTVTCTWDDNSTDETSFEVERATTAAHEDGDYVPLGSPTAADATSVDDSDIAGLVYATYRVRAVNAAGASAWAESNTLTFVVDCAVSDSVAVTQAVASDYRQVAMDSAVSESVTLSQAINAILSGAVPDSACSESIGLTQTIGANATQAALDCAVSDSVAVTQTVACSFTPPDVPCQVSESITLTQAARCSIYTNETYHGPMTGSMTCSAPPKGRMVVSRRLSGAH
jgi:hypothetical protein